MAMLTTSSARVIDPVLTAIARGYRSPFAPIADVLFPRVTVGQRGGRILVFGSEAFMLASTKRAPGANTKRVTTTYSSSTFTLVDYSLEGEVPIELLQEARAVPNLDLGDMAVKRVQGNMDREREKEAADLARTAANYPTGNKVTLAGADQWNDAASDPFDDINTAREAIRSKNGVKPNVLVVGPLVLSALRSHPAVLSRMSTAADRPPATIAQLQALFELDRLVEGDSTYSDGLTTFTDIWGKDAILAYTAPAGAQDMGSPSFGYTYQLEGYPFVEDPYFERNPKTWYYPVTDARQPVLVGPSAGYLFTNAVA